MGSTADNERAAFRAFYEKEFTEQTRRAGLIVGSKTAAADVVQDAMIAIWQRWGDLQDPGPYLNRCVLNGCKRTAQRTRTGERALSLLPPRPNPDGQIDTMWDAVAQLPFDLRAPVVLRFYGQLSNKEIAHALDWPEGSVGPRITQALRQLRKAVQ
ncbi:MAG: sigma factor-like helix-turn-helix DNA-binding protein [Acidimicrobiales bacterium]